MIGRRMVLAAAAALSLAGAGRASAEVLTYQISFSAGGFLTDGASVSAPVDPVAGEFIVAFDSTAPYLNQTADIKLDSLNIALGSKPAFTYDPAEDTLLIGGVSPGAGLISPVPPNDDFSLQIDGFTGPAPVVESFLYVQKSTGAAEFDAVERYVTVAIVIRPVGAAAPEPATWVLLVAGFAGIGALGRRRARRARAA